LAGSLLVSTIISALGGRFYCLGLSLGPVAALLIAFWREIIFGRNRQSQPLMGSNPSKRILLRNNQK